MTALQTDFSYEINVNFAEVFGSDVQTRYDELSTDQQQMVNMLLGAHVFNDLRRAALSIRNRHAELFKEVMTQAMRDSAS